MIAAKTNSFKSAPLFFNFLTWVIASHLNRQKVVQQSCPNSLNSVSGSSSFSSFQFFKHQTKRQENIKAYKENKVLMMKTIKNLAMK